MYKPLLDANNYTPTKKAVYTPGITVGLNHFIHYNQNGNSFLFSIWGALNRKHSLSDIFQPDDFQPYHSVYDSLIQLKSLESVYITDFEDITTKWAVDLGIRSVQMFDISSETRKRQLGISLSFVRNGLVNQGKFPSLFRTETGIVIPFLTNDGESTFNLEVFKRWDTFSNFPAANESFWGLRFNVPISSK